MEVNYYKNKFISGDEEEGSASFYNSRFNNKTMVLAQCKCGVVKEYQTQNILNGVTKSCGCYNVSCREKPTSIKKHKLYRVYWAMKDRCYNSNNKHYDRYGGRGITICDKWLDDYEVFYNWCMNNGYKDGLSIDRIDNDGNY